MSDISFDGDDDDDDDDDDDSCNVKSGDERRRSSTRSVGRKVNYNYYEEDDDDDDIDNHSASIVIDDDDDEVEDDEVYVFGDYHVDNDSSGKVKKSKKKSGGEMKIANTMKKKGGSASTTMKSSPGRKAMLKDDDEDRDDAKKYGQKMASIPIATERSKKINEHITSPRKKKATKIEGNGANSDAKYKALPDEANNDEGIDIVIPHSLLDKSRGAGKNECMVLVQVANEPSSTATSTKTSQHRPLDFHGQSGAIGRFEADGDGVILDLKGYQYRGTIRPGPTAMVVAMTRDGKLKVESITDEFVTLDAETRTDVMAKLDAVVENGSMDDTYRYDGEEDVNRRKRDNFFADDDGEYRESNDGEDGGNNKGKKKRVRSSGGDAANASAKKRKTSTTKKKKK